MIKSIYMVQILFNQIPFSNPDLVAPGRGAEQWHDRTDVNIPLEGAAITPNDVYYRRAWNDFEGATEGSYKFDWIRARVTEAIAKKQTFHFGIMSVYTGIDANTGGVYYSNGWSAFPQYLYAGMQRETVKSWLSGTTTKYHIPNWNSAYYHARCLALCQAVNNWIQTTIINSVPVKNVVGIIDIRLYGNWGEWHSAGIVDDVSQYPAGTFPTVASLKKIVDAHLLGFPNNPLVAMIAGYDANWLNNTKNPVEIAYYLLTARNNWGLIGWRRDQWGATDNYLKDYLENNNRSFNGVVFKDLIMERWKTAPITGEPPAWNPGDYFDLERQIRLYRATSFGNGNYGVTPTTIIKERVRAASKACGYRFVVHKADVTAVGNVLTIAMDWENVGIGNCWQDWNIVFEIGSWAAVSSHKLKFFQPGAIKTVTDIFTIALPAGSYPLKFSIRDPNGYRVNLPLAIQGADATKAYSLGTVQIGVTPVPVPNQGPIASAGGDIEITLPVNAATLLGSARDTDGTIKNVLWTKVSGSGTIETPGSTTTKILNLLAGTSVFRLTATDDKGATHSDDVILKVNPAVVIPVEKKIQSIVTKQSHVVTYTDNTTEIFD